MNEEGVQTSSIGPLAFEDFAARSWSYLGGLWLVHCAAHAPGWMSGIGLVAIGKGSGPGPCDLIKGCLPSRGYRARARGKREGGEV